MRLPALLLVCACAAGAEVRTLTLRQAIDLALKQNPDILIARLNEQQASETVRETRDPFTPKFAIGSGLAWTSGFPMSIEGSAPSVVQARAAQSLYNRPLSFQVAAAREQARGAAIDSTARREEVVHRIAVMYLSVERASRILEQLEQQIVSYSKIADAVRARVEEGRELPVEARAADLRVAVARQRLRTAEVDHDGTQAALAVALGFPPADRVRAAVEERSVPEMPSSEEAAIDEALSNSKQLQQLESAIQAQQMRVRSAKSLRYPQADLIAQYAVMARFNNYEEFFRRFQRNNWQLGMSLQLPLFTGSAASAQAARAELEISKLRVRITSARDQIALDTRSTWQQLRNAQYAREVAKMDLDVTRERLGVILAQFEEGRAGMRQVEELRSAEMEKWLAFYDAQETVERLQLDLLRHTGTITAALR